MARGHAFHHPGRSAPAGHLLAEAELGRAPPTGTPDSLRISIGEIQFANGNLARRVTISPEAERPEVAYV